MLEVMKAIIFFRYDFQVGDFSLGGRERSRHTTFFRWRMVSFLNLIFGQLSYWFASSCSKVVGDKMRTRF